MKRIQLFEFEDYQWLPNPIRKGITNLIVVFHKMMGSSEVIASLVKELKQKHDFTQIVDMGSGSGGPMINVIKTLNEQSGGGPFSLLLTDLYPNEDIVNLINEQKIPNVSYDPKSLNASNLKDAPKGLKTMVGSFHHMDVPTARKILNSAQDNKEPILIYEVAKNTIPLILWLVYLPLSLVILVVMSLIMTLFVRPLTISQVVFTYLIPIVPLVYAWDGQASLVRTYTFDDIKELIGQMDNSNYHWEVDDARKANGKNAGYYIMGYPTEARTSRTFKN